MFDQTGAEQPELDRVANGRATSANRTGTSAGLQHRDFVRRAGHDLVAPLRGIQSLTSFLREDAPADLDPELLGLLGRIDARVAQMTTMVTSLTTYARACDRATATSLVRLDDLIDDAILAADPPAGFAVEVEVSPASARLPVVQVTGCLERIIENCWHHHDRDSGIISIAASCLNGHVHFVVGDDGPGFDDTTRAFACEPFWSGPPAVPRPLPRAGMGLAIVAATAAAHHATVAIRSSPKPGAQVTLSWPIDCPLPLL